MKRCSMRLFRLLILTVFLVLMGISAVMSASTRSGKTMKYQWLSNARFISWHIDRFWSLDEAREEAKKLKASGANTVITFGFHYRFEHVDKWPQIKENLKNIVTACHESGLRVIEHHSATFVPPKELDHTIEGIPLKECTVISARDNKPAYFDQYGIIMLCCNNPKFRKVYFDYVLDLVKDCKVDGLMSDDIEFCPDWYVCGCDYCREKFKKYGGGTIPDAKSAQWGDHNDPWFRQWLRFRMKSVGDYYVDLRKAMDKANVKIPLLGCLAGASSLLLSQEWGMTGEEFARGVDLNFYEAYFECSNLYVWREQAAEINYYLGIGRRFAQPMFTLDYTRSADDLFFMWAFNLVQGDRLWLDTSSENARQAYAWESKHEELFKSPETLSNIAILFSRQTRDVYGEYSQDTYINEWTGWSEMLCEENIPYDTILDADLAGDLSKYKLLILPNAACLSNSQVEGLRRFVKNGGKVIATKDLAFCDETGASHKKSALSDWISTPPANVKYYAQKVGATQVFNVPELDPNGNPIKWEDKRDKELRRELVAQVRQSAWPLPWKIIEGNRGVLANVHRIKGPKGDFLVAHLLNKAPIDYGNGVVPTDANPKYNPESLPGPVTLEVRTFKLKTATLYSPDNPETISLPITSAGDAWQISVKPDQLRRYGAIKIDIEE